MVVKGPIYFLLCRTRNFWRKDQCSELTTLANNYRPLRTATTADLASKPSRRQLIINIIKRCRDNPLTDYWQKVFKYISFYSVQYFSFLIESRSKGTGSGTLAKIEMVFCFSPDSCSKERHTPSALNQHALWGSGEEQLNHHQVNISHTPSALSFRLTHVRNEDSNVIAKAICKSL